MMWLMIVNMCSITEVKNLTYFRERGKGKGKARKLKLKRKRRLR
jgi:hypothetical protein